MEYTRYNTQFTLSDEFSEDKIASTVTDIIMDEYEGVLIERCVRARYSFLEPYEQIKVLKNAKELSKRCDNCDFPPYRERKRSLYNEIKKYLKENTTIVPCGFVDFRMRDFYYYAEAMTAKGADMFFDEREYEEFAYLLSVFISEKESREEVIHLVWNPDGIKLLNKRRRDVTDKYEREFIIAAKEKGVTGDDLAISAVISANPAKLLLHKPPECPLSETLQKIFGTRCSVCTGCNICKNC